MKRYIVTASCMLLFFAVNGQQGVYKTANDFKAGSLTYSSTEESSTSIHPHLPFQHAVVKVKKDGETVRLQKDDLFGYTDGNKQYRFFGNGSYQILDPTYFFLYSRQENVFRGKAKSRETRYYFSKDGDSPVMLLTAANLKTAFPDDQEFHDLLDLQFRSDKELVRYDGHNGQYKLKKIYGKAQALNAKR